MSTATATPPTMNATYASFGRRFVALIIDGIIIGIIQSIIITPILALLGFGIASEVADGGGSMDEAAAIGMIGAIIATMGSVMLIVYAISIFYYAIMESSKTQGSVGKLAMGIKVTDMNGERISFAKGLIRAIGKIISGMILCIGYLMAAFTDKKQGLHDMIASTVVVKK
jgi:uncharacterized RDD family membrane protein YckC